MNRYDIFGAIIGCLITIHEGVVHDSRRTSKINRSTLITILLLPIILNYNIYYIIN